jgi:predicted acyltransferase
MIFVNNLGSWKYAYAPLKHAEWHGWTPTDLVFPFFLFIVGVSLSFSLSKRSVAGISQNLIVLKILRRSTILFLLGLLLALVPRFDFANLRIPGVLQRIAVCYLISSILFMKTSSKGRVALTLFFLAGYWALMKLVPVPGYGAGILEYEGNLCGYIDTKLLFGHLYRPEFDPEGILSTIPAVATTLIGILTGDWLRIARKISVKTAGLLGSGAVLFLMGIILDPFFPINKQLWTSTFVLLTAGIGLICLGIFYGIMAGAALKKWASPFIVYGTNAITAYVGSSLMAKLLFGIRVSTAENGMTLKSYVYTNYLMPWAGPYLGSLIFPAFLILLWLAILYPLYRRKIFIKI